MMNNKKGKISLVVIATIFLAILLIISVAILNNKEESDMILDKAQSSHEPTPKPERNLPRIENIQDKEYVLDKLTIEEDLGLQKKDPAEETRLKDLFLEAPAAQQRIPDEPLENNGLKTHPSRKAIEEIKQKKLIIY